MQPDCATTSIDVESDDGNDNRYAFKLKLDVYPRCFTYLNLTFDILVVEINPTVSCGPHSSEESVILKLKLSMNKNPQTKIH